MRWHIHSNSEMAQTARPESEKKEHFDSPEVLEGKVKQLAQWIRESDHFIAFTVSGHVSVKPSLCVHVFITALYSSFQGAGVSTSAGSKYLQLH